MRIHPAPQLGISRAVHGLHAVEPRQLSRHPVGARIHVTALQAAVATIEFFGDDDWLVEEGVVGVRELAEGYLGDLCVVWCGVYVYVCVCVV